LFRKVLEKWKNMEKSKLTITASHTPPNILSTPNTPKLHRRSRNRRFSESDSAPEETTELVNKTETLRRGNSVRVRRARVKEVSATTNVEVDNVTDKSSLESIQQFTSEIEKLSQNVSFVAVDDNNNTSTTNPSVTKTASPIAGQRRELRSSGRRSRSPNAIIVRRKSIKSITPPPPAQIEEDLKTPSTPFTTSQSVGHNKQTIAQPCDLEINTVSSNKYQISSTKYNLQDESKTKIQQRTTADGKPIGYATKIMGSPTLRHTGVSNSGTQLHLEDPFANFGNIIDDSPEKIKSDLDSYIEQSFRDIETTMRRRRRRPDSGGEVTPAEPRKRERRGNKTREKQDQPVDTIVGDDDNNSVFKTTRENYLPVIETNTPCGERTRIPIKERRASTLPMKPETITTLEEVVLRPYRCDDESADENKTIVDKNSDNTMDTMREFEEFLRKQERKTKKEIKRLSREGLDGKTLSQENLSRPVEEVTVEQYKKTQAIRRRERKEFQDRHLRERRLSLGNKWPSLGNIFFTNGKLLERKLSLPSNLERPNYQSRRIVSSVATNSSTESLEDQQETLDENNNNKNKDSNNNTIINNGRQSAPPTVNLSRSQSFPGLTQKHRANSTGHSPDLDSLLHFICDIEEEIISSGDEEGTNFKSQQLENFNSNLDELKSQSSDSLNRSKSLPRRGSKGFIYRSFSENQIGIQQRKRAKLRRARVSIIRVSVSFSTTVL